MLNDLFVLIGILAFPNILKANPIPASPVVAQAEFFILFCYVVIVEFFILLFLKKGSDIKARTILLLTALVHSFTLFFAQITIVLLSPIYIFTPYDAVSNSLLRLSKRNTIEEILLVEFLVIAIEYFFYEFAFSYLNRKGKILKTPSKYLLLVLVILANIISYFLFS